MRFQRSFAAALAAAILPLLAVAAEPVARTVATASSIEWHPHGDPAAIVLSVQRADGHVVTETFAAGRTPLLRAEDLGFDGTYTYELHAVPRVGPLVRARLAAARAAGDEAAVARIQREAGLDAIAVQMGSFTIANGAIAPLGVSEEPVLEATTNVRIGDPVGNTFFTDDVSAQVGVCAGTDCTASESYGFASIKMKENNTRLKWEDTSSSAGFATTDWQLSAGDTFSGGVEKFFLEDLTAGTVPVLIEGNSPTSALYVDSTGRIGFRTSAPARDLHISTPNFPTIRLEQNTLGGFAARSWELAANDANFVLRDVTGLTNPVIVRTSAPTSSLVIDSSARIGLGVALPTFQIHHVSGARLDAGNWTNASSREVKQEIRDLDVRAARAALGALEP
ncbi:MAG TPA: hypothetical protein VEU30_10460, partial [Thermoanaerobaculia bacterium]|nr:hypothetical protein [Thermoanaerobaculia bacterium]